MSNGKKVKKIHKSHQSFVGFSPSAAAFFLSELSQKGIDAFASFKHMLFAFGSCNNIISVIIIRVCINQKKILLTQDCNFAILEYAQGGFRLFHLVVQHLRPLFIVTCHIKEKKCFNNNKTKR